ncbi:MAG: RIP metalloprotease RseP [Candidatus Moranbacteria bacterium CG_4_8_14_3_um_filter_34_16]|nr:MAG: RIP metalloprotease RseP [Candidatus Moranbacteria bacterium CG08_land_8_20_14_0_20_34_16]PIW94637.1 MAG: RIP metalloprotease RseP [Candidatus Moranbacteria bacterium CG_4_8_14_3_um_filter_34_16]PJA89326.1 MAG: RIP metalloprotease RseP [Candidatus Moranbacteria bacterium CG_4_9_14_3_um_filter_33_15]
MLTTLIFIAILGILILVHEMGHFLVARRNGIKAEEFGFGFPPRIFGFYKQDKSGKYKLVFGNKNIKSKSTVYSLNWIPLGGFVKIKGENGSGKKEEDSFAFKSAWIRSKVLVAGVTMNFILAWILISFVFMLGIPETIDSDASIQSSSSFSKIQIVEVLPDSPAEKSKLEMGDEISKKQIDSSGKIVNLQNVKQTSEFISSYKGKTLNLKIKRGGKDMTISVVPRINPPQNQGALGISLTETTLVKYSVGESFWNGFKATGELIFSIFGALFGILKNLFIGNGVGADVSGPVGIAIFTKKVAGLGLVYILQFAAILSVNLGVINILPFPALDGGRILFIAIEKMKGSPVSQKVEQTFHMVGFVLLITLLILVTFRDVARFF